MLKFQLRPSSATTANSPMPNNNSSFSSSFSSSSACSSLSISSINSTTSTSSQHQRLSQISTSSRENEEIGNESPPSSNNRRPICNSPSPSLPDSPSSLPPPMPSLHLAISPPPLPPKPLKLFPRAKSSERSLMVNKKEFGYLRIYTGQIKSDTDYKTLRVAQNASTSEVIRQLVVEKLRLSLRDLNLFHLFMEVRTMRRGDDGAAEVRSILELDGKACPLELERCHPEGRSRFILGMDSNAILARIYDGEICPESNYKSVFISRRTTCSQVLTMLRQMCRLDGQNDLAGRKQHSLGIEAISELRLFVQSQTGGSVECLIPGDCCLAGVYLSLLPGEKIVLRRVIVPRNDGF